MFEKKLKLKHIYVLFRLQEKNQQKKLQPVN